MRRVLLLAASLAMLAPSVSVAQKYAAFYRTGTTVDLTPGGEEPEPSGTAPRLTAAWDFAVASCSTVADTTGNGYTATAVGDPTCDGSKTTLDGDDYFTLSTFSSELGGEGWSGTRPAGWSMAFEFSTSHTASDQVLAGYFEASDDEFYIRLLADGSLFVVLDQPDGLVARYVVPAGTEGTSGTDLGLRDGQRHTLGLVFDGYRSLYAYVDGVEHEMVYHYSGTQPTGTDLSEPLTLGAWGQIGTTPTQGFVGDLYWAALGVGIQWDAYELHALGLVDAAPPLQVVRADPGNAVFTSSQSPGYAMNGADDVYWLDVHDLDALGGASGPSGERYMVTWSTDHGGASGFYYAYATSPALGGLTTPGTRTMQMDHYNNLETPSDIAYVPGDADGRPYYFFQHGYRKSTHPDGDRNAADDFLQESLLIRCSDIADPSTCDPYPGYDATDLAFGLDEAQSACNHTGYVWWRANGGAEDDAYEAVSSCSSSTLTALRWTSDDLQTWTVRDTVDYSYEGVSAGDAGELGMPMYLHYKYGQTAVFEAGGVEYALVPFGPSSGAASRGVRIGLFEVDRSGSSPDGWALKGPRYDVVTPRVELGESDQSRSLGHLVVGDTLHLYQLTGENVWHYTVDLTP